jgi:hypothetical protein
MIFIRGGTIPRNLKFYYDDEEIKIVIIEVKCVVFAKKIDNRRKYLE